MDEDKIASVAGVASACFGIIVIASVLGACATGAFLMRAKSLSKHGKDANG